MKPEVSHAAVAVVVVNWNTWQLSLECLAALRQSQDVLWHLYLIDNASSDGSELHLSNLGPNVTFIQAGWNGGWTGGNNIGVRRAIADGYQSIFLLNSDALVERNTLKELLEFVQSRDDLPVVGPLQTHVDRPAYSFIGASTDPRSGMPTYPRSVDFDSDEEVSIPPIAPTSFVQGSGLFASSRHFEAVGLFDERFYLNFDESDWCFRIREAGFPCLMLRSARLRHHGSASIGGPASPIHLYFVSRNGLLFSKIHCTLRQRLVHAWRLFGWGVSLTPRGPRRRRLMSLLFGKAPSQRALRAGVRDFLTGRFGDCPLEIRQLGKGRAPPA